MVLVDFHPLPPISTLLISTNWQEERNSRKSDIVAGGSRLAKIPIVDLARLRRHTASTGGLRREPHLAEPRAPGAPRRRHGRPQQRHLVAVRHRPGRSCGVEPHRRSRFSPSTRGSRPFAATRRPQRSRARSSVTGRAPPSTSATSLRTPLSRAESPTARISTRTRT